MEFNHIPVMLDECIEGLNVHPSGNYMDATLGGGGHSSEIATRLDNLGKLICFDLDIEAINYAKTKLTSSGDIRFINDNFKNFTKYITPNSLDGILADFGVSSYQLDNAERGFSYMQDGPLKMCMDPNSTFTAENVVNEYSQDDLVRIFSNYGEERFSKTIAKSIVEYRKDKPITTTKQLSDIIENSVPTKFRYKFGHPAKRVFQAIRIEVNGELDNLREFIFDCVRKGLRQGGRLVIITFHSLEDRIVKEAFRELSTDCLCDKKIPVCVCNHKAEVRLINKKPLLPSESEISNNARSHSAKVRILEKL